MNINRHNYEEYFLLYTDNELSALEREAVERFVRDNTDLEKELELLTTSTFRPDNEIILEDKQHLMRAEANKIFIHAGNCEELFVLYGDDELSNGEKAQVELFVYDHPQYQEPFELLQSVKLLPDLTRGFPGKKVLYRHESNKRPITPFWWKLAAAAVMVLFGGILWLNNTSSLVPEKIVELQKTQLPEQTVAIPLNDLAEKADLTSKAVADKALVSSPAILKNPVQTNKKEGVASLASSSPGSRPDAKRIQEPATPVKAVVAKVISYPLAERRKFRKPVNPVVGDIIETDNERGSIVYNHIKNAGNDIAIKRDADIKNDVGNTSSNPNEAFTSLSDESENVILANIPLNGKNSLRGIFRKASRFIDRSTAMRPVRRSGLTIGNIEIAFQ